MVSCLWETYALLFCFCAGRILAQFHSLSIRDERDGAIGARIKRFNLKSFEERNNICMRMAVRVITTARVYCEIWIYEPHK